MCAIKILKFKNVFHFQCGHKLLKTQKFLHFPDKHCPITQNFAEQPYISFIPRVLRIIF